MTGIRMDTGIWLDISPDTEFELTIENPLLRDDRIPSTWSTDISLPPTALNKRALGYIGAFMSEPAVKKLKATIVAGGLGLFDGTLEYDSIDEHGNLVYTFSARNLDDDWNIKIHELPGFSYDESSGYDYDTLIHALKDGDISGIHLPLVINESLVAETACIAAIDRGDRYNPGSGSSGRRPLADYDWGNRDMKYRNSPGLTDHTFMIPAVDIMRLLEHAIGKDGAGDLSSELSRLVIFATWWTKFYPSTNYAGYTCDIGGALPDISLRELVKSVCSMFCAAVFIDRNGFQLHTARAIMENAEATDWSGLVDDTFTCEREAAAGYGLSYGEEEREESGTLEKDGDIDSLSDLLDISSEEYEALEHTGTGVLYSARSAEVHVYVKPAPDRPDSGYYEDISEILCDRLSEPSPVSYGDDGDDVMSVQIGLSLVRCVPTRHFWYDFSNDYGGGIQDIERMAALLSLPSVESDRPSEAYVAVLHEGQASDKGVVIGSGGDSSAGLDITPEALFEKYHKAFAAWVCRDRQRISVKLDMSIYEAASFRMWRKVRILGRIFLVEKLSIRFYAGSDDTEISADLIGL